MSTRADQAKSAIQRSNSAARRAAVKPAKPTRSEQLHIAGAKSAKGRALHAPTKLRADAKALEPNPGKVDAFWKTGINGGEPQTVNGVTTGRGADGTASVHKASRKSTRGAWPGGEKDAQLPRERTRKTYSPENRGARAR